MDLTESFVWNRVHSTLGSSKTFVNLKFACNCRVAQFYRKKWAITRGVWCTWENCILISSLLLTMILYFFALHHDFVLFCPPPWFWIFCPPPWVCIFFAPSYELDLFLISTTTFSFFPWPVTMMLLIIYLRPWLWVIFLISSALHN